MLSHSEPQDGFEDYNGNSKLKLVFCIFTFENLFLLNKSKQVAGLIMSHWYSTTVKSLRKQVLVVSVPTDITSAIK